MSDKKNNNQPLMGNIQAFLENSLIEAYLKGKGYTPEDLKKLPEEEARQLMKEACTYASGKLAEVEIKAQFVQGLHDAITGE
jgi:hypothetical protein